VAFLDIPIKTFSRKMRCSQVPGCNFPLVEKTFGAFFPNNGVFKENVGIRAPWKPVKNV
jgi:hypothetical protein